MKKKRYEKPVMKVIKAELGDCIAVSPDVLHGDNINSAFGGNGYHDKNITVDRDQDLSNTWGSDWNKRN